MYQLLKSKSISDDTHSKNFKGITELITDCDKTLPLKGGYVNCLQKCDTKCGDGKKRWKVICPPLTKCSGQIPSDPRPDEPCIGQECAWLMEKGPYLSYYFSPYDHRIGDCGTGIRITYPYCSYKRNDKYCIKSNCLGGICLKPFVSWENVSIYQGCKCKSGKCTDTYNNKVDVKICDQRLHTKNCQISL